MLARDSKHRTAFASLFGLACAHASCMILMVCIREACVRPTGSSWLASGKPPQVACTCVTIVIVRFDRGSKVTSGACSLQLLCSGCICDALLWFAWPGRPAVSDPKASSGQRIWKRRRIFHRFLRNRRYPAGEFGAGSYPRHCGNENDTPLKRLDTTAHTTTWTWWGRLPT